MLPIPWFDAPLFAGLAYLLRQLTSTFGLAIERPTTLFSGDAFEGYGVNRMIVVRD